MEEDTRVGKDEYRVLIIQDYEGILLFTQSKGRPII